MIPKNTLFIIIAIYLSNTLSLFSNDSNSANAISKFPTAFIENKGQWAKEVRYLAKLDKMNIWITNDGVVYDYFSREYNNLIRNKGMSDINANPKSCAELKGHIIKTTYVDSKTQSISELNNSNILFETSEAHSEYFNYILGSEEKNWVSNVSIYDEVIAKDVYTGIDVRYYFEKNSSNESVNFRYDFVVNSGANPSNIRIKTDLGNSSDFSLELIDSDLTFNTSIGKLIHQKPYTYQDNRTNEVSSQFQINNGIIEFNIGKYDISKTLIIDPLVYSTYLSGNYYDSPNALAVDLNNNVFICGSTYSSDFPRTSGAYNSVKKNYYDGFISKLNSSGSALIYSTFVGGSDYDYATGIAVDTSGNAYVTGYTYSSDFPFTKTAIDTSYNGYSDCFILKLTPAGNALKYSTYFGGLSYDFATGIKIDAIGNAFIIGNTNSIIPVSKNAYKASSVGGYDCFLAKVDINGSVLLYSSYIGGSNDDFANAMAIDPSNNIYITGYTNSTNFPTTVDVYSNSYKGNSDCFVVKMNTDLPGLSYSTLIGGAYGDYANAIAIDINRNAYITGYTYSADYPTSTIAISNYTYGNYDAFVTKLNSTGSALDYSTYIGGSNHDYGTAIAVNSKGNAFVAGNTYSNDFVTTSNGYDTRQNGTVDGFIFKLNPTGTTLAFSSYFGGIGDESISAIVLKQMDNLFLIGTTYSIDFPTTKGAYNTSFAGYSDGFISCFSNLTSPIVTGVPYYYSYCAGSVLSIFYSIDDLAFNSSTTFYSQLSDSTGSFKNPTTLGSLTNYFAGYIYGIIPINMPYGYQYRVRVISKNPDGIGNDNGFNLSIYSLPNQPTISKQDDKLESSALSGNQWFLNGQYITGANSQTYKPLKSGVYSVTETQNSCSSIMSPLFDMILDGEKITAGFKASTLVGEAPLKIIFTDTSSGNPNSWEWDFGDNQTSTEQNPTHIYTKAGSFSVKLTVKNGVLNDSHTNFSFINVQDPINMTADFIANKTSGDIPLKVQFSDNSSGSPIAWIWDFGDDKVSTEANPIHTYEKEGQFDVTLKILKGAEIKTISKNKFVKTTNPLSIKDKQENQAELLVSPSPNSGLFTIQIKNAINNNTNLRIYNTLGQDIYSEKIYLNEDNFVKEFNLNSVQSGNYLIKLNLNDKEITKQFMIIK